MVRELAGSEGAYRGITQSCGSSTPPYANSSGSWPNSTTTSSSPLTTAASRWTNSSKVVGDRNVNTNLRYKLGRNLSYNAKDVYEAREPKALLLPQPNLSTAYIFATGNRFFCLPQQLQPLRAVLHRHLPAWRHIHGGDAGAAHHAEAKTKIINGGRGDGLTGKYALKDKRKRTNLTNLPVNPSTCYPVNQDPINHTKYIPPCNCNIPHTNKQPMQLLQFIEHALNGVSRSRAKAILSGGGVRVDRKNTRQFDLELRPGQAVEISKRAPKGELQSKFVKIVYEDPQIIVIEKAPGILSMATSHHAFCVKQVLDDYFHCPKTQIVLVFLLNTLQQSDW